MMMTVAILINGKPVFARSVRNVKDLDDEGYCLYEVDDGTEIRHNQHDGVVKLAIKVLKTIKE